MTGDDRARFWSRRRLVIAAVIAGPVLLAGSVGVFGWLLWQRVDRVRVSLPGSPPRGTTFLLIGSDSRAFVRSTSDRQRFGSPTAVSGERADVMLLVRAVDGGGLRVLGIPRDLVVQLPDGSPTRMTLALLRGPQTVVDTVCQSLGIGVDHLMMIHFDGLRRLVDRVGGVTVRADAPQRDRVTGFAIARAGSNRLDGQQALAYIRSRRLEVFESGRWRSVPASADGRSDRARAVLVQLGARLHLSPTAPFSSIDRLWTLSGAVTVDGRAGPSDLRGLARDLRRLDTAQEERLPVTFHPGAVPTADLQPTAVATLEAFQGGAQPGCSLRLLHPTAHSPVSAPAEPGSQGGGP